MCTVKRFGYSFGYTFANRLATTVKSASASFEETPGFKCPSRNQNCGNAPATALVSSVRFGFAGIHRSALPQPNRGGMTPMSVLGVPFNTNVLFNIFRSAPNSFTHPLYRSTKTGGAPGS